VTGGGVPGNGHATTKWVQLQTFRLLFARVLLRNTVSVPHGLSRIVEFVTVRFWM
jgi:hypothetical protein